jgi:peptide/nickel transport system substrate-binding protein
VGLNSPLPTLDPPKAIGAEWINQLSLETLLRFGPKGNLEPDLATSVTQPNPVTYIYHLRHGVRFWDGSELTAADVAYSLNADRAPGSQLLFSYTSVKSITAASRYSAVVTLTHPDASWQYVPAEQTAVIFEKKFAQAHKTTFGQGGVLVMGSGPWKLDSFDPATGATLSANPHWWGGKVPVQRVTFTFFSNANSEALGMRAGEIDVAPDVLAPKTFASTSGAPMLTVPGCNIDFFGMNVSTPPWNDIHLRRAVAYALDRPDIIAARGGDAAPVSTLIPAQLLQAIASPAQVNTLLGSLNLYPYSLAKARQEMAESAYPHGVSTTILEWNDPTVLNESQALAAELQKIGIHVQIKVLPVNTWDAVQSGPAPKRMAAYAFNGCFSPDPSTYDDLLGSQNTAAGSWNVADYAPQAVDTLLTESLTTTGAAGRFAIYSKLLQRLQDDVPYVALFLEDAGIALSSKFAEPGFSFWPSPATSSGYPEFYLDLKPAG